MVIDLENKCQVIGCPETGTHIGSIGEIANTDIRVRIRICDEHLKKATFGNQDILDKLLRRGIVERIADRTKHE